mmetsp:Transcript_119328/g.210982  ORF Transcript_119328/g.210982 Transcript_119328/m.210982 type:complete len:341 (+) Transcript_119328:105-1127(+)
MPIYSSTRKANESNKCHSVPNSPKRRKMYGAGLCPDSPKAATFDDAEGWINITEQDPMHGFERVDNLDFKHVQNSLDQLQKSVRLLGRMSGLAQPPSRDEPKRLLLPSVYECMRRSGPKCAEVVLRDVQYTKPEDPPKVVEIVVKHETDAGQMKLSMVGKRDEPVTIAKVKEAVVAELGGVNTSEFGFILRSGDMTALRLDYDIIRPSGKKRQFELVVRGIELPKPSEPQVEVFEPPVQQLKRRPLSPLSTSQLSMFQFPEDADLSPALSVSTGHSWRHEEIVELRLPLAPLTFSMAEEAEYFLLTPPGAVTPRRASLRDIDASENNSNQDADESEWSML